MQSSSKDPPLLPPPPPAQSLYINSLNLAIFVGYVMSTASVAVPVVLLPTIAKELSGAGHNTDADCPSCSSFSASIAGFATAGTALGKFFLGFTCDAIGARRTMMLAFAAMSLALVQLSFADAVISVGVAQGLLEFLNSVNWPCMAVILATHYSTDQVNTHAHKHTRTHAHTHTRTHAHAHTHAHTHARTHTRTRTYTYTRRSSRSTRTNAALRARKRRSLFSPLPSHRLPPSFTHLCGATGSARRRYIRARPLLPSGRPGLNADVGLP